VEIFVIALSPTLMPRVHHLLVDGISAGPQRMV
jgi:hypothetical protein